MLKKFKILVVIISFMLVVSIFVNVCLGIQNSKLNQLNKEIRNELNEIQLSDEEENNPSEEENKLVDNKADESDEKGNDEVPKNNNDSTNNKINTTTNSNEQQNNNIINKEVNELIGTWQYVKGSDVTTYVFKADGTLWINDEYVDKYSNGSAICDNCLTHKGLHEIQYMIKDGILYINFYKETRNVANVEGVKNPTVYYLVTVGSYVKAKKIS